MSALVPALISRLVTAADESSCSTGPPPYTAAGAATRGSADVCGRAISFRADVEDEAVEAEFRGQDDHSEQ